MKELNPYLDIAAEVEEALASGKPVVALESTIISHGMPYPQNVETALKVEQVVRDNGAIPATIAIINGRLKVGISKEEIDYLGKKGHDVIKTSRRDVPVLIAKKEDGATTVATTHDLSCNGRRKNLCYWRYWRGSQRGRNYNGYLCRPRRTGYDSSYGCLVRERKSILDLGLTLEYLETKGVPVLGYQTKELPAFYTRESGFEVDFRVDTPQEIADIFTAKIDLGLKGGMLVTNPIPVEYAMDHETISKSIEEAVERAESLGIKGKETTPYLLNEIQIITKGESLKSNIQLVLNNAALASKIACEMCR